MEYQIINKNQLTRFEIEQLRLTWNEEYPVPFTYTYAKDFDQYLEKLISPTFFVVYENENPVGWCFCFTRDENPWFGVILKWSTQGKGVGKMLLNQVLQDFPELNGWVIVEKNQQRMDGSLYRSPLDFYKKLGFEETSNRKVFKEIEVVQIKKAPPKRDF